MLSKIKLYIVDIEEITINRLEELFYNNPQLGIKVVGYAHNYISCINDIERVKNADVLLISAYLPDQMGIDLIAQVKKVNPLAKVIIMITKQTSNLAEVSKAKGADEVITKPFKAKALIDKIEELVEREFGDDEEQEALTQGYESGGGRPITRMNLEKNEDGIPFQTEESFKPEPVGIDNPFMETPKNPMAPAMSDQNNRRALFDVYSENPIASNIYMKDRDEDEGEKPNVVAVFTSTSSAGKTTMLVNVAAAIHKESEYKPKICILDFNLLFPSVLYKFHQDDLIMCRKNLYDVVEDINSLDETLIRQALVSHEPTGIQILETPSDVIRDFSRINADSIEHLISYLRSMFDLILIDTSSNIRDDATIFPLTVADKGIVLMEPDLGSLLHTRKFITMMKLFENNLAEPITPKLNFVLNKENPKTGIHVDTIKKTLFNTDVKVQIPEDLNITHLGNNGQFVTDSSSIASKHVMDLARLVYPFEKEFYLSNKKKKTNSSTNGSLFGGLFNKKKK